MGGRGGLNCVAELDAGVRACAAGPHGEADANLPLYGMPVLVKDNIDVAGLHTTAGSVALLDNLARRDAPVIANLRRSGAVIIGKTNMTEFANYTTEGMPNGYSSLGGQVRHAVNPNADPGGSSSGSGVAVCAGIVPMAVGTDTSFSVIACAQRNGICGIKPPIGALSQRGILPIATTLDSAGSMARSFNDALRLYSALRDEPLEELLPARLGGLRLALNTANIVRVSDGQRAFTDAALAQVRAAGGRVCEIEQGPAPQLRTIMKYEFKPALEAYLRESSASRKTLAEIVEFYESRPEMMLRYGDTLLREALFDAPGWLDGDEYRRAIRERDAIKARVLAEIGDFDAVIMTGPTNIMHLCGLPSVTVAGGARDELGVKRALIMYGADERRLYAAALALERILPAQGDGVRQTEGVK